MTSTMNHRGSTLPTLTLESDLRLTDNMIRHWRLLTKGSKTVQKNTDIRSGLLTYMKKFTK